MGTKADKIMSENILYVTFSIITFIAGRGVSLPHYTENLFLIASLTSAMVFVVNIAPVIWDLFNPKNNKVEYEKNI